MRRRRDLRLEIFGVVAIALVGAVLWVAYHPDAGIVRRAEGWPVLGPLASAARARWSPPSPPEAPAEVREAPVEIVVLPPPRRAPRRRFDRPSIRIGPGNEAAPRRSGLEPVGPVPAIAVDPDRLARARRLLGPTAKRHEIGGYALWTDVVDRTLPARWDDLVAATERAWRDRNGLEPIGGPEETIFLFAHEAPYRELLAGEPDLAGIDANGVAGAGLLALARGVRPAEIVDATLVHELAHLLARRSIGPALPPWLGEGLAEDLSHAPLGPGGDLDPSEVRGVVSFDGPRFQIEGGAASLDGLGRRVAAGEALPTLGDLEPLDVAAFAGGESGRSRYATVFAWFRFLHSRPGTSDGLRRFLAAVRDGEDATVEALEDQLGVRLETLVPELGEWVLGARRQTLARLGAPTEIPDERGRIVRHRAGAAPESAPADLP